MKVEEFINNRGMASCSGGFCSKVYRTDRDTFIIQGNVVEARDAEQFSLGCQEGIVEIPATLVIALADKVNSTR